MIATPFDLSSLGSIYSVDDDHYLTADQLREAIHDRVACFAGHDLGPGKRILLARRGNADFFIDLFAAWSLGACAICCNNNATTAEHKNLVSFTEPHLIITAAEPPVSDTTKKSRSQVANNISSKDAALILFTSGSIGEPKAVVLGFGSIAARLRLNRQHAASGAFRKALCVLPVHFGHGLIGNCLTPLLNGGDLILAPATDIRRAATLGALISDHKITFTSAVPAFWKMAVKLSTPPASSTLRQVSVGSAPVSASLLTAISQWAGISDVRNMYGTTENGNWVAGSSIIDRPAEDGLIGTMWGGEAAILSEGKVIEQGCGELLIKSESMMDGYYNRPDLTRAAFVECWYRTGDLGSIDADGLMRLTGRLGNEINRAGIKISPEVVETLLESHPQISEACTFGLADELSGEIVAAALHCEAGFQPDIATLREYCQSLVRREYVPERWYFLERIPRTDRGKVDRQQVKLICQKIEKS